MVTTEKLLELWDRCIKAKYTHVENEASFAVEEEGETLYLLFQKSNGKTDWKNNLDFPAKPYKDMDIHWKCHRGFLRVWKSIKPYIEKYVANAKYKKIFIVGYSHGAAIAMLCHEYVWYNRPDLRDGNKLEGYGFGCPRCYFGWHVKKKLRPRWQNFYPVRNMDDLVTHMPPVIFGFRHVNYPMLLFSGQENNIKAHYPNEYREGIIHRGE